MFFVGGSNHLNSLESNHLNQVFYFLILNNMKYEQFTMNKCMETLKYEKERYDFINQIKSKDGIYCIYSYYGIIED